MPGLVSCTPLISRNCRKTGSSFCNASASARAMITFSSGQPALAPLVALHVAIALAVAAGMAGAEIELAHVFVLAQGGGGAVHDDAPALENVAMVGVAQRHVGVLLGEKKGHAL